MNDKVKKVKEVIRDNFVDEYPICINCGIFNTRNFVGDPMYTIYKEDDVSVDVCSAYSYFEVFGLTKEEFKDVEDYYNRLKDVKDNGSELDYLSDINKVPFKKEPVSETKEESVESHNLIMGITADDMKEMIERYIKERIDSVRVENCEVTMYEKSSTNPCMSIDKITVNFRILGGGYFINGEVTI